MVSTETVLVVSFGPNVMAVAAKDLKSLSSAVPELV